MNATQRTICAGLMLAATACGGTLRAEEPSRKFAMGVNAANATLRGGDVDGAIKQYGEMRSAAPESAVLSYNMAVAQYRKGDVAAAAPLFESAATSENDTLAANARYNLGNCNYAAGLKLAESDREAAIKELETAIDNYRSSLSVDTNNADARANIELAARLIDKLREEQQQQEQQQNEQQQQNQQDQQQSNDQQQDNQQQQGSQGKQDEKQQNEDKQNQDQQQQEQNQNEQSAKEQNSDQNQQKQEDHEKDQQSQQEQQSQSQQDKQRNQSAQKQQQQQNPQDAGNPEQQKPEEQGEKPPQGELSAANEEEAKQGDEKREAVAFDPAKDGEMTQQEAEKMLQAIRDRDLLRRYNRRQNERQQYVPVDRDW